MEKQFTYKVKFEKNLGENFTNIVLLVCFIKSRG